jgi:predicted small metal-binding protein
MTKQLTCGDVVPGCSYVATAPNELELMQKVAKHAAEAHNVKEITPELLAKVKAAVKETR